MLGIRFTTAHLFSLEHREEIERLTLKRAIIDFSIFQLVTALPEIVDLMASRIVNAFYANSGDRITIPCYLVPPVPLAKTAGDMLAILEIDISVLMSSDWRTKLVVTCTDYAKLMTLLISGCKVEGMVSTEVAEALEFFRLVENTGVEYGSNKGVIKPCPRPVAQHPVVTNEPSKRLIKSWSRYGIPEELVQQAAAISSIVPSIVDFTRSFSYGDSAHTGAHTFAVCSMDITNWDSADTLERKIAQLGELLQTKVLDRVRLNGPCNNMLDLIAVVPIGTHPRVIDLLLGKGFLVKSVRETYNDSLPVIMDKLGIGAKLRLRDCSGLGLQLDINIDSLMSQLCLQRIATDLEMSIHHVLANKPDFDTDFLFTNPEGKPISSGLKLAIPNRLRLLSKMKNSSMFTII